MDHPIEYFNEKASGVSFLNKGLQDRSIAVFLISAFISLMTGFISSWFTHNYIETRAQKQERIPQQVIQWANPVLSSVTDIKDHLNNILNNEGYLAMKKTTNPRRIHSGLYHMNIL